MIYKKLLYDFLYAVRTFILRQKIPYMFGLQLNDNCNLHCFYCHGNNKGEIYISYDEATEILQKAYKRGNRSLYITGGEPMLWTDKNKTISDIVNFSYSIGFFTVVLATNGTQPLTIPNVTYLITIDGPRDVHNRIRNNTFDLVINNIKNLQDSKAFATITITKENYEYIEEFIISIASLGIFRGILFNTLTHVPAMLEKHGFNQSERAVILDMIWKLKVKGFPIILSKAAYKAFRNNNWVRPIQQIEISVGNKLFTCCRDIGNKEICFNCGYLGMIEISQVLKLRLSALLEVIKLV